MGVENSTAKAKASAQTSHIQQNPQMQKLILQNIGLKNTLKQYQQLKKSKIQQWNQMKDSKEHLQRSRDNIAQLTQQLVHKDQQIEILKNENSIICQELNLLKSNFDKIKDSKKFERNEFYHIFQGKVLHNQQKAKLFLRKSIEQYLKKKILYTRLVYNFDKINPANFHQYIDNVPNICTIIETVNGIHLAGFSVDPLNSDKIAGDKGLLFSLTNQIVWRCLKNKRSVTYDQYYLIYGNSEIRLKTGDNKIFSNFGINARCFQCNGQNISDFIGQNIEKEVEIVTYDIFEIVFQNQN